MSDDEFVYLTGTYTGSGETEKALLVEDEDGDEMWIPKSVIGEYSDLQSKGDSGDLMVARWFAIKEELDWM